MLANIALTAFDNYYNDKHRKQKVKSKTSRFSHTLSRPMIRYADDFVIVCESKQKAVEIKADITQFLSDKIGLELSDEKTKITHIYKGFDFLGFTLRKYKRKHLKNKKTTDPSDYVLLITPTKESVQELIDGCKEVIRRHKTAPQSALIRALSPKLIGWGMYYRHAVSADAFSKVDSYLWDKLRRWGLRRHLNKGIKWVIRRYFNTKTWNFRDKDNAYELMKLGQIPIRRFVMVKKGRRVYNPDDSEYWSKREYTNAFNQIASVRMRRLYRRQTGKCDICRLPMNQDDIKKSSLHTHHMKPRSLGGTESYSNLRLLHGDCHIKLHAKLSRQTMYEAVVKHSLDYIRYPDKLLELTWKVSVCGESRTHGLEGETRGV